MYQPEPDQDKAQRHANLLLVFVIGVLIGASLVANHCDQSSSASEESSRPRVLSSNSGHTRGAKGCGCEVVTRGSRSRCHSRGRIERVSRRVVTKEATRRACDRVVEIYRWEHRQHPRDSFCTPYPECHAPTTSPTPARSEAYEQFRAFAN